MYANLCIKERRLQSFNIEDVDNVQLSDFTINCQNGDVSVHKVVVSTRCNYFREVIEEDTRLAQSDFSQTNVELMKQVMKMVYGEEVLVKDEDLLGFIKMCQTLRVRYYVRFDKESSRRPPGMKAIIADDDPTAPPSDEELSYASYSTRSEILSTSSERFPGPASRRDSSGPSARSDRAGSTDPSSSSSDKYFGMPEDTRL